MSIDNNGMSIPTIFSNRIEKQFKGQSPSSTEDVDQTERKTHSIAVPTFSTLKKPNGALKKREKNIFFNPPCPLDFLSDKEIEALLTPSTPQKRHDDENNNGSYPSVSTISASRKSSETLTIEEDAPTAATNHNFFLKRKRNDHGMHSPISTTSAGRKSVETMIIEDDLPTADDHDFSPKRMRDDHGMHSTANSQSSKPLTIEDKEKIAIEALTTWDEIEAKSDLRNVQQNQPTKDKVHWTKDDIKTLKAHWIERFKESGKTRGAKPFYLKIATSLGKPLDAVANKMRETKHQAFYEFLCSSIEKT